MKVTLAKKFLTALGREHRRRVAICQLMALSDSTLRDIGLHRGEIHPLVEGLLSPPTSPRVAVPGRSRAIEKTRPAAATFANDERFEATA